MPQEQSYLGYVYLIGSQKYGWYKIGKSKNAKIRVSDIGILLPFKIEVFAIWGTSNETILESEMHKTYAGKRINGEWFGLRTQEAKDLIKAMTVYPSTLIYEYEYGIGDRFLPSNMERDREFGNRKGFNTLKSKAFMNARYEWCAENGLDPTLKENKKASKEASLEMGSGSLGI